MHIALCFNRDNEATLGVYFERALKELGHVVDHFWTRNTRVMPRAYDLYLRIDHGDYQDDLLEDYHPAAFYVADTHLPKPYRKIRRQAMHYEFVFCAQEAGAHRLRGDRRINASWLPVACDPQVHCRLEVPNQYDVSFVGTDGKKVWRTALLKQLRRHYQRSFLAQAPHTEMARIYSASTIGFNCSVRNDINMRMFEIMSCGTLLVTNALSDPGFLRLFQPGVHLVTYRTERELFDRMDYYLTHPEERQWIADNGRRLVHALHTYRHRVEALLDIVRSTLQGRYAAMPAEMVGAGAP